MAGSQDAWKISGEDRSKHDVQFFQLKPVNGFITGTQARDFFVQSGLPTPVLGQIWNLADINGDGKMDKKEFSIAMHLIKKKLQGYELPKVLPASLKLDPTPVIGTFAQPQMSQPMGMGFPMSGMPVQMGGIVMPGMLPQASLGTATMTTGSLNMAPLMANGAVGTMIPSAGVGQMPLSVAPGGSVQPQGGSIWAMPYNTKLKHTQTFNANDRNKRGYLLGVEARAILMQSGLPQPVLAQIWALSDIDRDGKLTCDEFCIAMYLSELARMGTNLPAVLPAELFPTKARSGSLTSPPSSVTLPGVPKQDAFGDLLGSAGMSGNIPGNQAAMQPLEDQSDSKVTLEDKRKENFDKGQAELERRRALLREQQQREENERLEKERHEAEKRERQRLEVESKRQADLQRQLEKQREKEREIEEQRRKMMEQREAARRELERQRQMEWEKQRKEQLMAEKQREYEQLSILKSQMANLRNELESLDSKKTELSQKIVQVQRGVTDFTSSIDAMRVSRDRTLADIDVFERQSAELNRKLSTLGGERDKLNIQVQTVQATPLSDAHRTVLHSVENKRTSIQQLKKEVEQLESDTEARLGEIDCNNAELRNLKEQLTKLERDLPQLQKQQEERAALQKKATLELQQKQRLENKPKQDIQPTKKAPVAPAKPPANSQPSWFDFASSDGTSSAGNGGTAVNWDSAFSGTVGSAAGITAVASWSTNGTSAGDGKNKMKYRALYDFQASREDELSLVAGTELWVFGDFTPIPGMEDWHKGEYNGVVGWFPKAYVERLDEPSADVFGSAFEPVISSSAPKPQVAPTADLFSSVFSQPNAIPAATVTTAVDSPTSSFVLQEGLLAKAIYPWKARQESDLTFEKDDVILVKEQQDIRWFGELNGKSGWFPNSYVKLIGVANKSGLGVDSAINNQVKPGESISPAPTETQGEYYIAMYAYTSEEPTDLNFNEGDMICVTSTSGDWWSGTIEGRNGIFPATYVKKLDIQTAGSPLKPSDKSGLEFFLRDTTVPITSTPTTGSSLDDLFGSSPLNQGLPSVLNASSEFDVLGITFGGLPKQTVAANMTMLGSMNKGQIQVSTGTPSDLGIQNLTEGNSAQSKTFAVTPNATIKDDFFADLGFTTSLLNKDSIVPFSNIKKSSSMGDLLDSDPFGGSSSDPFGGSDPFSNVQTTDFVSEDPFNNTNLLSGNFQFETLSTKTSAASTSFSTPSLVDNANFIDSLKKPVDLKANTMFLDSLKPSLSLPDVQALENDAKSSSTLNIDIFSIANQPSISLTSSGGLESTFTQADLDGITQAIRSKRAPLPPIAESSSSNIIAQRAPEQKSVKKPEIARVIAPYVATGTGQLSLETGNLINVRQKSPRGWWEGELQVRGQKKKIGWFPANYVKLLGGSSARSTPEPLAAASLTIGAQGSRSATPQSTASQEGIVGMNQPETVVALYAYVAQNDDELTFQKDAVITVLNRDNPDWWNGQLDGKTGVFPSNYVTPNPQSQS